MRSQLFPSLWKFQQSDDHKENTHLSHACLICNQAECQAWFVLTPASNKYVNKRRASHPNVIKETDDNGGKQTAPDGCSGWRKGLHLWARWSDKKWINGRKKHLMRMFLQKQLLWQFRCGADTCGSEAEQLEIMMKMRRGHESGAEREQARKAQGLLGSTEGIVICNIHSNVPYQLHRAPLHLRGGKLVLFPH